ncbi:MAG TPA: hypothetical protein DEA08_00220 [Planctomycetes bacterium]|nr:hypothetical protein [Planctomycetota bacterium]
MNLPSFARAPRAGFALLALLSCAAPAAAQDLAAARDAVRRAARNTGLGSLSQSFSSLASDGELSGGDLVFENRPDLEVSPQNLLIPFEPSLIEDTLDLRVELELGYLTARITGPLTPTVYGDVKWQVFAGSVGAGPSLRLPFGLRAQPLFHLGLAWVSNRASYRGPDALAFSLLFDDVIFDVHALYGSYGGSFALRHPGLELGELTLGLLVRYDLRRSEVLDTEKDAERRPLTSQWLTLRVDLRGPLWSNEEWRIDWLVDLGYRRYLDELEQTFELSDYGVFGGGVAIGLPEGLRPPLVSEFQLTGSYFLGEKVRGWTAGLSASF